MDLVERKDNVDLVDLGPWVIGPNIGKPKTLRARKGVEANYRDLVPEGVGFIRPVIKIAA